MKETNLRRDPLDYLLTDTTPVEMSELFTYTYFYEYLHKNRKSLEEIVSTLKKKEVNVFENIVPFDKVRGSRARGTVDSVRTWLSSPLTYQIIKPDGKRHREMSIPQPLAALNMYFFIHLYQRDILNILEDPVFSVRYHTRNNDLIYKNRSRKALIDYQYSRKRNKKVIEQTGRFFDIRQFIEAKDVGESERWRNANIDYELFCKIDLKRCFPSVYTHAFKWIVTRDVVDSKSFKNSNLFAVIDRVLQNINGASSNGVLVGPEFSRMIVEILLQQIDKEISSSLSLNNLKQGIDYEVMRFVDDYFIFTHNEEVRRMIVDTIEEKSRHYLLEINQLKVETQPTPYYRGEWLGQSEQYKDKIKHFIRSNAQIKSEGDTYQITCNVRDIYSLKSYFERLISKNKGYTSTITSYILSVILNSMSSKRSTDCTFFKKGTSSKVIAAFIEYIFYVYSHSVSFKNTQKLISILYYCHEELNLKGSKALQSILHKYEQVLSEASGYSDYINLLTVFDELDVHFSLQAEEAIFNEIKAADDPVALATFWSYAKYNERYMSKVSKEINNLLGEKLRAIRSKNNELQYREFWYTIIFNKCPYIDENVRQRYVNMLRGMLERTSANPSDQSIRLIATFMLDPSEPNTFISWNVRGAKMLQEITYRTHRKTIFRRGNYTVIASL